MNCRRALHDDYPELATWWEGHGWPAVPIEILPVGFIVEEDGKKLAACFTYMDRSTPVAYLEYFVTNPENSPRESHKACDFLFDKVMEFLRLNLIKTCFARLNSRGLLKMYKKHGFVEGDEVKDMVWHSQQQRQSLQRS